METLLYFSTFFNTSTVLSVILLAVVLFVSYLSFFTVQQQTAAIVQRFGKHLRIAQPGLHIKIPIADVVAGRLNLRVQQLNVEVETKTEDNVFVHVVVSVQYYVLPQKAYDAFYRLSRSKIRQKRGRVRQ